MTEIIYISQQQNGGLEHTFFTPTILFSYYLLTAWQLKQPKREAKVNNGA
jgi:hypothetical protein